MAGERVLPGLGLIAYYDLGDNTWKPGVDENFRALSLKVNTAVLDEAAVEPGGPVDGEIYLATAAWDVAVADDVVIRDNGVWVAYAPADGWIITNLTSGAILKYVTGSGWIGIMPAGDQAKLDALDANGVTPISIITDAAGDRVISNSDLDGKTLIKRDNAGVNTCTVNAALTGTEPVTVVNEGAGQTSFVAGAGVTINSADGALSLRVQYSMATLIPQGSDVYLLVGDIVV